MCLHFSYRKGPQAGAAPAGGLFGGATQTSQQQSTGFGGFGGAQQTQNKTSVFGGFGTTASKSMFIHIQSVAQFVIFIYIVFNKFIVHTSYSFTICVFLRYHLILPI